MNVKAAQQNTTKTITSNTFMYLSRQRIELPEDDAFALKHTGATNIEQYNKLPDKCAFVCSLYSYIE
jgi:hypothetical protein